MSSLDHIVRRCREGRREREGAKAVAAVLRALVVSPEDVEEAVGVAVEAGETTLFTSPELTVSRLVLAPGMAMYPHNHGLWTVIGVYRGAERNIVHRRSERGLDDVGTLELRAGDVAVLDEDVIHSVVNPVGELTAALHVFGGDLTRQPRSEWDATTLEERPYDGDRVRRLFDSANTAARAHRWKEAEDQR